MVRLAMGKTYLELNTEGLNLIGILAAGPPPISEPNHHLLRRAMANPIGTPSLKAIAMRKRAKNAVIIVNDITRPTPYRFVLPPVLSELHSTGLRPVDIKLIVALGIHRPHTEEENRNIFGHDIMDRYEVINHNCDQNLKSLGTLSNGMELEISREAAETDLLITTGVVELHYFAGYSGGRKSILPGIASRKLIEANHKMMDDSRASLGRYQDNPVHKIMLEAAKKVHVDFIVNVVMNSKEQIGLAVCGDVYEAWLKAVQYCEQANVITAPEKADIVIASAGGYPKDINFYQAQKALEAAVNAVKKNGTIILAAECPEGLGEATFARWLEEARQPEDIKQRFYNNFELGGHKAFAICKTLDYCQVILVSSLDKKTVNKLFMEKANDVQEALQKALNRHGKAASIYIMPEASKVGVKITHQQK